MTDLIALLEEVRTRTVQAMPILGGIDYLERLDSAIAELREQQERVSMNQCKGKESAPVAPAEQPKAFQGLQMHDFEFTDEDDAPTNAPVERTYEQVHETGYVANPVSDDARDAARYRWLRESWLGAPYGPGLRTAAFLMEKVFSRNVREFKADGWMLDLDAAIDAAMRGKP